MTGEYSVSLLASSRKGENFSWKLCGNGKKLAIEKVTLTFGPGNGHLNSSTSFM